jgi:hypothetical protein
MRIVVCVVVDKRRPLGTTQLVASCGQAKTAEAYVRVTNYG